MMKTWLTFGLMMMVAMASASADVIGPLVRVEKEFPGYAVFQTNGRTVKRGEKVTLARRGQRVVVHGTVTEASDGRCLVKFDEEVPLFRGDVLHAKATAEAAQPSLGVPYQRTDTVRRTRISRERTRPRHKAGDSPHVMTPAEFAAQSRSSSVYSLGQVSDPREMATQSRRSSTWTLGRTMTVNEFAAQMNR